MNVQKYSGLELRSLHRRRVLKSGRVKLFDGVSSFNCLVRNVHESGAMLEFGDLYGVPNDFQLEVAENTIYSAKVQWREGSRLGVQFIN